MDLIKRPFGFLKDIYTSRSLLYQLTKRDIENRYLGSFLGIFWIFAQPFSTIFVMYIAFEFGFKPGNVEGDVPFVLWLIVGMIPWFFISEGILNGANAVQEQGQIIKKIVFRVSILPLVKIFSSLLIHFFFIVIMIFLCIIYGFIPGLHTLQIIYYLMSTIVLLLGLGWLSSSVVIFFKDFGQFINVMIQLGFWITPIFWQASMVPDKYQIILKLNPFYYLIEGYRHSLFGGPWFWQNWKLSLYFWAVTIFVFLLGIMVFKKLKPHFADVL